MFTILGTDDAINTCDCCGRTNLKHTVIVQNEAGDILHYGSVCATRHTKYTTKDINQALGKIERDAQAKYDAAVSDAKGEMLASKEWSLWSNKMREATEMKLIGVAFRDFCKVERDNAKVKEKELIEKYNLTKTNFLI